MKKTFIIWLLAIDLFFVVLHLFFGANYDIFNLDRERTPAALWSSFQLVGCAFALAVIFFPQRQSVQKIAWGAATLLFTLLSFDEISELHENVAYYLVKYFQPFPFLRSGTPMWIVFLSPLILASLSLLALIIKKLFQYRRSLGWLASSGCLFFLCALTLEFVGGIKSLYAYLPLFVVLEEGSELVAGSLFFFSFATYAKECFSASYRRI
ncbi:hypothetical protein HY627_00490 [Candidatus Uhrbacteria bacterium]|nr:hypothetical protein [Candidatus Uhrbacteria bacterium]